MVPFKRAMVVSYRLSIVTVALSVTIRPQFAKMKKTGRGHCCETEMSDYVTPSVSETTKFNQCEKLKQCWKLETMTIKICYWMQYQDGSSSS